MYNRKFGCKQCGRSYSTSSNLTRHIKERHKEM
ncbi:MAG: hypothetical protein FJ333_02320 [Sphingomonadales bacterium]|nr:hypothetical protein [Sphingomonadales bacterium]